MILPSVNRLLAIIINARIIALDVCVWCIQNLKSRCRWEKHEENQGEQVNHGFAKVSRAIDRAACRRSRSQSLQCFALNASSSIAVAWRTRLQVVPT